MFCLALCGQVEQACQALGEPLKHGLALKQAGIPIGKGVGGDANGLVKVGVLRRQCREHRAVVAVEAAALGQPGAVQVEHVVAPVSLAQGVAGVDVAGVDQHHVSLAHL